MNVVVVDWDVCCPANSGKRQRTLNLMLELADRHSVVYFSRGDGESSDGRETRVFLAARGIDSHFANLPVPVKRGWSFYRKVARNLASPAPYAVDAHMCARFRRKLHEFARGRKIDLWQVEWSPYVELLRGAPSDAPVILMAHNVDSLIWRRYAETETRPWARSYLRLQHARFERYERRVFRAAHCVVAVSDDDAQLMRDEFAAERVAVVENGVRFSDYAEPNRPRDPREMLFLGGLDWRPNIDGLKHFLARVLPLILAEEPAARLTVVGRNPSERLAALVRQSPQCELAANAPDVRPYLARAGMMVVPLRIGGGSRLKILEAAASWLPIVSTTVGAEGLRLAPDRDLAIADTVEEFVAATVRWMRAPHEAKEFAARARQTAAERYCWSMLGRRLDEIWHDAVDPRGLTAQVGAGDP